MNIAAHTWELFLQMLFPTCCVGCGREGMLLCAPCVKNTQSHPPVCIVCGRFSLMSNAGRPCPNCRKKTALYGFLSPYRYEEIIIKDMVQGLKYQSLRNVAEPMADMLLQYLNAWNPSLLQSPFAIVPIPLHSARERQRGFNQSALLGAYMHEKLQDTRADCVFEKDFLIKIKNTASQTQRSGSVRRQDQKDLFLFNERYVLSGRTILLLDDVKTTGATLEGAAHTLKEKGLGPIWAITFAR